MKQKFDLLEINEKDRVLANIKKGKHYVNNPLEVMPISAQKGPTCWYYARRYLTPRFGAGAFLHESERKKEIVFSNYRIQLTKLADQKNTAIAISNILTKYSTDDEITLDNYKLLIERLNSVGLGLSESANLLLKEFASQSRHRKFDEFIEHREESENIKLAKECIRKLGYDPFDAMTNLTDFIAEKVSGYEMSSERHRYHYTVLSLFAKTFHLQYASWQPSKSFDHLLDDIRNYGTLQVGGHFGTPYYKGTSKLSDRKLGSKGITFWPKGSYVDIEDNVSHAILIVGAERCILKNRDKKQYKN